MDSKNKLLKIAYFDETSAIDYLSVFNGGNIDSEVKESKTHVKEGEASSELEANTGILGKVLEPFITLKAGGKVEGRIGTLGENIVSTTISNTVLSDYVATANNDENVSKIAPKKLRSYPNSISSIMMYTPLLKMFDFKAQGFDFSLFDETLEKIKGYLELIAELDNGSCQILRFNNRAFRNNYKLVDLTRMDLTFYCVHVGKMSLDQLNPENEFSLIQNDKIIDRTDITGEQESQTNFVPLCDVVLAGIVPNG